MANILLRPSPRNSQAGAAAVEFAVVASAFLLLVFATMEIGRLMYLFNTVQEVTRRAAREAAVTWTTTHQTTAFKQDALLGGSTLPAGGEVGTANLQIQYLNLSGATTNPMPTSPTDNAIQCENLTNSCIASVQVSISGVTYAPMVGLLPFLAIPLPASTVTTPVESLGG